MRPRAADGGERSLPELLARARALLAKSVVFQRVHFGEWAFVSDKLWSADVALVAAVRAAAAPRAIGPGRALCGQAFALCGFRAKFWPDGLGDRAVIRLLERALALDPGQPLARLVLADAFYGWGQDLKEGDPFLEWLHAEALEVLGPAASAGEPFAHVARAVLLGDRGRRTEAVAALHAAVALGQNDASAAEAAAQELRTLGHEPEAEFMLNVGVQAGHWPMVDQRPFVRWPKLPVLRPLGVMQKYPELQQALSILREALPAIRRDLEHMMPSLTNLARKSPHKAKRSGLVSLRREWRGIWYETGIYMCEWGFSTPCDRAQMPAFCDVVAALQGQGGDVAGTCPRDMRTHSVPAGGGLLRLLRAAVTMVGPPKTVIDWHMGAEQGRLRLSCAVLVPPGSSSVLYFRDDQRLEYTAGECFWFDETVEHKVIYNGDDFRASVYLDAFHPGLYAPGASEFEPQVRPRPFCPEFITQRWYQTAADVGMPEQPWHHLSRAVAEARAEVRRSLQA